MRKYFLVIFSLVSVSLLSSCMRGISPEQAANGKAKCGKTYIR
ncbi:MAG: hypothetical protein NTX08_12465 [Sphingobacteriales bacterium]|nr:hypothetical protein [Sphingobacteriales bacterium]